MLEQLLQRGWLFGGESSGHLLCLDYHTTGDGIIAALQILTALRHGNCRLSDLVGDLKMYPQKMVNVAWETGKDWRLHSGLNKAKADVEAKLGDRGRVLIRASGTEPKLRLMVEAETLAISEEGIQQLLAVDVT